MSELVIVKLEITVPKSDEPLIVNGDVTPAAGNDGLGDLVNQQIERNELTEDDIPF